MRAADVFKRQPTPPPIYYLTNHVGVEYNESDWPTTPEGEEEASREEGVNDSNHSTAAGGARMVVRGGPLGLLSVKMRVHREKEIVGRNGSKDNEIPKEGRFASPGMPSVPFPHIVLTLVVEQSSPAAKADIPQGPPSVMRYSKATAESNVKPRTRKPLVAATANATARKKPKAASKSSRRRLQVVLTHATEEKENLPLVSDDEIDDPLVHAHSAQKKPEQGAGAETGPGPLVHHNRCASGSVRSYQL